jgi:hypothetical protein
MDSVPPPDKMPEPPTDDGWLVVVIASGALYVLASMLVLTGFISL